MSDDPQFFAWLDGELDPDSAARMEARVDADPELRRLAEQHRALQNKLKAAFDPIAAAPVPERLASAALPRTDVIDLSAARERRRRPFWQQAAALAATLIIGVMTGATLFGNSAPIREEGGRLVASGELDQALDTRLASAQQGAGAHIGLTFRDGNGAICRSFTGVGAAGLACRDGSDWRIRGLFQGPEGQSGDYRMAAGQDPRLMALIDETITGEPFDAEREAEAMRKGWTP